MKRWIPFVVAAIVVTAVGLIMQRREDSFHARADRWRAEARTLDMHCHFEASMLTDVAHMLAGADAQRQRVGRLLFHDLATNDFHDVRLCQPEWAPRIYCGSEDAACMQASVSMAQSYLQVPPWSELPGR